MKEKKFIRFVYNTNLHSRGEKIKALNIITKVFDDNDKFLYIRKPYIFAQENQIEIDIEGTDYKQYLPLHHFKYDKGNIVKKTDAEIQAIEQKITQDKQDRALLQQQKKDEINTAKLIILDAGKTDKEKLDAIIDIIKSKGEL